MGPVWHIVGHTMNNLVITIAILVISIAASLQGRETLVLLSAAFMALKRTWLSCMDNEAASS